ncbi:MAG TPA: hypothetical protein PLD59_10100, partial [Tepidisphaeraceae bacterium]|nr:hypothetical protein [Tepidisphaeraceae bacterium]
MEALAHLLVATVDLFEAEGRTLRRQLMRLALAISLIVVAALLVLFGLGFVLYGLFQFLAQQMSEHWAAVLFGVVTLGPLVARLSSFEGRAGLRQQ